MNGQPFYLKVYVNEEEWFITILPKLMFYQSISALEIGYITHTDEETIHVPISRQPFHTHGKRLHTICRLDDEELDTVEE